MIYNPRNKDYLSKINAELNLDFTELENVQLASALIETLEKLGPPTGDISESVALILVTPPAQSEIDTPELKTNQYWLRWDAAQLLTKMYHSDGWPQNKRISASEAILIEYIDNFYSEMTSARTDDELNILSQNRESGKLARRVVELVGTFETEKATEALRRLNSIEVEKFRSFPFLRDEIAMPPDNSTIFYKSSAFMREGLDHEEIEIHGRANYRDFT